MLDSSSPSISSLAEARRTRDLMSGLEKTEGWKELCRIISLRIEHGKLHLTLPLDNITSIFNIEYDKGRLSAYMDILRLPTHLREQAEVFIELEGDRDDGAG